MGIAHIHHSRGLLPPNLAKCVHGTRVPCQHSTKSVAAMDVPPRVGAYWDHPIASYGVHQRCLPTLGGAAHLGHGLYQREGYRTTGPYPSSGRGHGPAVAAMTEGRLLTRGAVSLSHGLVATGYEMPLNHASLGPPFTGSSQPTVNRPTMVS